VILLLPLAQSESLSLSLSYGLSRFILNVFNVSDLCKDGRVEGTTVVELHTLPLPTYEDASPAAELETLHLSWHNDAAEEEQKLIAALAQQARNGSDASFKVRKINLKRSLFSF